MLLTGIIAIPCGYLSVVADRHPVVGWISGMVAVVVGLGFNALAAWKLDRDYGR
jgi:hypothetical protein